jgi:hypothetical protein
MVYVMFYTFSRLHILKLFSKFYHELCFYYYIPKIFSCSFPVDHYISSKLQVSIFVVTLFYSELYLLKEQVLMATF